MNIDQPELDWLDDLILLEKLQPIRDQQARDERDGLRRKRGPTVRNAMEFRDEENGPGYSSGRPARTAMEFRDDIEDL